MITKSKKIFFVIVFLMLSLSAMYAITIPNAEAAEINIQTKGAFVASSVIGIDSTKYSAANSEYKLDTYFNALPQENTRYTLQSAGSKLDLYYTFVNGKLEKIHVLDVQGSPQMQKAVASDSVGNAKSFLQNYKTYSGNSFYENLSSMLTGVVANKNSTATSGNIKMSVTSQDRSTTFKWTYVLNGIEAPDKYIALDYENGFLGYFIDNWDLYKIANTNFNVSPQKAIDTAMASARDFTWAAVTSDNKTVTGLKYTVTNAMVSSTTFSSSIFMNKTRGQDPLMLYPMHHIWVSFDKFYPCNVYGMDVYVWADTGEIAYMQERFTTDDPPADLIANVDAIANQATTTTVENAQAPSYPTAAVLIILPAVLISATFSVYALKKKSFTAVSNNLTKSRQHKVVGLLLCFLMASTIAFELVQAVGAVPNYGRSTIWGSESKDAWNSSYNLSWRKHPDEVTRQQLSSAFLRTQFDNNGYYASDYQGIKGSDKSSILTQVQNNPGNYPRVAVIDFDHGNGNTGIPGLPANEFHYMFEDQRGTFSGPTCHPPPADHPGYAVYDYEIWPNAVSGKYFFVLINACNSAHVDTTYYGGDPCSQGIIPGTGRARGMPFAWTNRLVVNRDTYPGFNTGTYMSDDGFARPDSGNFIYLGFLGGSAALSQNIDSSHGPQPYWEWLEHFISYALYNNWSVKQALNEASQYFYGGNFDQVPLHTGFLAIWPMFYSDPSGGNPYWHYPSGTGKLLAYGNTNIKLYQPQLTLAANNGLYPTFTLNTPSTSQSYGVGTTRLISNVYTVNVNDMPGYVFDHFSYQGTNFGRGANIQIAQDGGTLTAYYNLAQQYIDTSATADVWISPTQVSNGNNVISWVCGDDYGAYYCHLTDVYIDGNRYDPSSFGDIHSGSITFTDYAAHSVSVYSTPDTYPVTFNQYAHDDNLGNMLVNSWTEYHVAWEEVGGPHYSHGSDLHGGGGEDYYVGSTINDPWGYGTDNFNYAMAHNWGGGSESYYYSIPLNVWTYTWGNTVDIYYNHAPQTYSTTVNVWVTYDGYNYYQQGSYNIDEPAGSNYLDFGYNFILAYNYYDSSTHYANPDWYNLGTGTTIDVGYWG